MGNTYENHGGVMVVGSQDVTMHSVVIGEGRKELDQTVQAFSQEAERLLAELEAKGEEISELKQQVKAFCDSAAEKKPRKDICGALLGGIKAALANASAVETLFNLGKQILELL